MESRGIYTLANDAVFDQLIALFNSIEMNVGANIPICIIPYDDRCDRIEQEIQSCNHISLYGDRQEIERWEEFARKIWAAHPKGQQKRWQDLVRSRVRVQRKMVVFQGIFEEFLYVDADSLVMQPVEDIFAKLEKYDFVFDDWESKKQTVTALDLNKIAAGGEFTAEEARSRLHCSNWFASKRGFFSPEEMQAIEGRLLDRGEIEWINGIDDAFVFSYLTLRNYSLFNYTLSPDPRKRTGNCADADRFVNLNNILYNEDGFKPIHRIHYMNYTPILFARLCRGEDVDICYREIFLHYRFLKEPDRYPKLLRPPSLPEKILRFVGLVKRAYRRVVLEISNYFLR